MRHTVLPIVMLLVGLGCGGSSTPAPTPGAPEDAPTPDGAPPAVAAPSSEPESAAPLALPTAKVTGIMAPTEGKEYLRVQVVFENPNDQPCRIEGYTLRWGDDDKRLKTKDFTVPAQQSRERRTRIHPGDGKLDALTVENASAEIDGGCAP